MNDFDDFELGVDIGVARDAAEADSDDPIARLPRLIRYGLNAIGHKKSIRERIGGEIWEAAPELAPKVTAWLAGYRDVPMKALVKRLDSLSVQNDKPVLRSLANAVLLVSLSPFLRDRQAQSRIALALKVAFDEIAFDIPLEIRVQAARLLIGWSMVTAGAFTSTRFTCAIDMVSGLAHAAVEDVSALASKETKARSEKAEAEGAASRDGLAKLPRDRASVIVPPGHIIVCPPVRDGGKLFGSHHHIVGKPVPLKATPDLVAVRRQLAAEFPHAMNAIDRVLADLVSREHVHLQPLVLVGSPGSGKSRFVRRLAQFLGLFIWRNAAATADGGALGGTDRRWSSAQPCHPFLAISAAGHANPIVMIDEVEKAPTRSDYGRLWDILLSMCEPETAKRYLDPALQVECDLSMISFIATANSIAPLPGALRDRMRMIAFPEPSEADLAKLLPLVLAEVAAERGLDLAWIRPFSGEETDLLANHWPGGSLRQLRRMVDALLAARENDTTRH